VDWDGLLLLLGAALAGVAGFSLLKLRRTTAELRGLFAAMSEVIIVLNREGRCLKIVSTNPQLLVRPVEEQINRTLYEIHDPEKAEIQHQYIQQALDNQRQLNFEYDLNIENSKVWFAATVSPLSDETVLWVARDITDLKQAEEALRQSEATNRALIHAIPDLLLRLRQDGIYLDVLSDSSYKLLNSAKLSAGTTVFDSLPFDRAQERMYYTHRALETGNLQVYEQSLEIDGATCVEEVRVLACRPDEVLVMVRDITDRKRTEEALQKSEAKFRNIFENSQVGIFRTQADTELVLDANQCLTEMLGYGSASEVIGQKYCHDFYIDPEQQQYVHNTLHQMGEVLNQEIQLRRADGSLLWGLLSARLNLEENCIEGVLTDICDRKQAEAALQQAVEAAQTANRAKSTFLANMSHELRTPLNIILGFTQLLIRGGSTLNPQQQEQLNTINRSGEHLLTLINDVLEMSKIEAGRVTLNENDFDLGGLLDWLYQMFQFKSQLKALQLVFDRQGELPEYIRTDESKLRQVLVNLLGNAIKFTTKGTVTLRVYGQLNDAPYTQHPAPYTLCFEVEDTGPGISPEDLEHLFQPFVQTETGQKSQEGTGLGLAISQKFVQLMGGEIAVKSVLESGTTFSFSIQTYVIEADGLPISVANREVVSLEPGQPEYRILIVEDRVENRQILMQLLTPVGFQVREAEHGQEAIEIWEQWSPHFIWMDIRMPVMDGYQATKRIVSACEAKGCKPPIIIALTGSVFEEDRRVALSMGCNDFVRKPFRTDIIFEKMEEYLGLRYVYADSSPPVAIAATPPAEETFTMTAQGLRVMPGEWIGQLHQAATKVNAKQVLSLIQQIPEQHAPLAQALTQLVDDFCFEEIVELTRQVR
jgi:PAS domain S-box-containing protein